MARILILYSSRYGQTAKISHHISHYLQSIGFYVDAVDVKSSLPLSIGTYSGVIVGTPLYVGHPSSDLVKWVRKNKEQLQTHVTGFFTVSLNAADTRPQARIDDQRLIEEFKKTTGWTPRLTASFAGALRYTSYNFLVRMIMKRISKAAHGPLDTSKEYEMTRWNEVDAFAEEFLMEIKPRVSQAQLPTTI